MIDRVIIRGDSMLARLKIIFVFLLINSTSMIAGYNNTAEGLSISPKRIILDSKHTSSSFLVRNKGTNTIYLKVSRQYMQMQDDGLNIITENPSASLGKYLRYSPRKIEIKPGDEQIVRIMLRSAKKFQNHEFNSKVIFKSYNGEAKKKEDGQLSVNININTHTVTSVMYIPDTAKITNKIHVENLNYEFKDDKLFIYYDEIANGDTSAFNNRTIFWINPNNKKIKLDFTRMSNIQYPARKIKRETIIKDNDILDQIDKKGKLEFKYKKITW
jgi:P pilus assembly chaperone PapD